MKFLKLFVPMVFLGLALAGCPSKNNPNSPSAQPTATPGPVTVNWVNSYWFDFPDNGSNNYIDFDLQVNGSPSATVGVTVTGGGVTLKIPFSSSPVTTAGLPCADYRLSPVTFTAGTSYVFSTTTNGQTSAATVVAPGVFTPVTDPTTPYDGAVTSLSWAAVTQGYVELQETGPSLGNNNFFTITTGTTSESLPTGTAPTVIGYGASAPSTYTLQTELRNAVAAPTGSTGDVEIQNYTSQPLTLQ